MRVKVRYICAGCGWRWVRDFAAPLKVAATLPADVTVEVPKFASPCCGEDGDD